MRLIIDRCQAHFDGKRDWYRHDHAGDAEQQPAGEKTKDDDGGMQSCGVSEHHRTEELVYREAQGGCVDCVGQNGRSAVRASRRLTGKVRASNAWK